MVRGKNKGEAEIYLNHPGSLSARTRGQPSTECSDESLRCKDGKGGKYLLQSFVMMNKYL